MNDNKATLIGFIGAFTAIVLVAWSIAWYYDNKPEQQRPLLGKCLYCKERAATLHFGDMLSFTHGGGLNCCALCAAEKQLAFAREQAALVPEREAEVARLRSELREA